MPRGEVDLDVLEDFLKAADEEGFGACAKNTGAAVEAATERERVF